MTKVFDLLLYKAATFNPLNPLDIFDILLALAIFIGSLYYLSHFPVFRVVLGVLLLVTLTLIAFVFNFIFTGFIIGLGTLMIIIAFPMIFSHEIRHYLEKLGRFPFLNFPAISKKQHMDRFIHNLVAAVYELAERKIGGTIVIARKTGLGETIETGVVIDAKFGSKILENLFFPKSPLHDGAVVIKNGRIIAAGCLLPIFGEVKLEAPFGTRHRAGISITTDTDAVVILISEERGEVSLAENGKLEINLDRGKLTERLSKLL